MDASSTAPQARSTGSGQPCCTNNAKARWLAVFLIAGIGLVHVWIISAGRFTHWPTRTAYYSLLADGFLKGQLSLPIEPDPRLLASPDPYDPRFNSDLRLQDAALYHGKYYIYWGPGPALLLVPVRLLAGRAGLPIGDQYVFFAFTLALLAISAKMVLRARRRFFPEAPWWTIGFGIVIAGLVNPIPFLLANASIYQTAIIAGQVFLLSGIYAAWLALDRRTGQAGIELPWLLVAGACWAMAIGCRISLAPAVVALSGLLAWRLWFDAGRLRHMRRSLVYLALPLLAGASLFGAYNQARFGSPWEFGARYVLAGQNMHAMVAAGTFASARYIPVNLVRYLLEAPVLQWRFPFICPYGTAAWGWFGISVNKDFIMDSVAGMVWAAPVFGLAAVPVWVGLRRAFRRMAALLSASRRRRSRGSRPLLDTMVTRTHLPVEPAADPRKHGQASTLAHDTRSACSGADPILGRLPNAARKPGPFWWMISSLLVSSALGFLPSLMVAASLMRYLADATPSLAILASFGVWMQYQHATPQQRPRRVRALLILTAYSALTGVLLGVAGHYGRFITDNFPGGR